jgi:hypothetical protein
MIKLEYQFNEVEQLREKFAGFDQAYAAESKSTMVATLSLVEQNVISRVPIAVGTLSQSITSRIMGEPTRLMGEVGSPLIYAPVMEFGRRPGSPMPPSDAIRTWIIRKGIASSDQADGLAFVIARSIGRKGIKARRMFRNGWRASRDQVNRLWWAMPDRVVKRLQL